MANGVATPCCWGSICGVVTELRYELSYVLNDCGLHLQYNAASHSLGVALHSGSGGLCRDTVFDLPKPLFVLKELICFTTCGDLYRSQKPNRFVCFVVCCHWRHYYARMHSSRLGDLAESARYAAN